MATIETILKRKRTRRRDAVSEALRESGINLYQLSSVQLSPSPHLTANAILDKIVEAVEGTE